MTSDKLINDAAFQAEAKALYESKHTGPYAGTRFDFLTFMPLKKYSSKAELLYAQAAAQEASQFLEERTPAEVVAGYESQHKLLTDHLLSPFSANLEILWDDGKMLVAIQHPFSRGSVRAASASTFDPPIADPRMLHNPLDMAFMVDGVKFARRLAATKAISVLKPIEIIPGAAAQTDAELIEVIKMKATTFFHPVGTCKLGKRDEGGVVDGQLKVYGIDKLRVVDASVIPILPASHTMATVYAVAEKVQ